VKKCRQFKFEWLECHVLDHEGIALLAKIDDLGTGLACFHYSSQSICKTKQVGGKSLLITKFQSEQAGTE
jgi:hypothetical protein